MKAIWIWCGLILLALATAGVAQQLDPGAAPTEPEVVVNATHSPLAQWGIDRLEALGVGIDTADKAFFALAAGIALVLAFLLNWLTRRFLLALIHKVIEKTKAKWDDAFLKRKVFDRMANIAPALVIYALGEWVVSPGSDLQSFIYSAVLVYLTLICVMVLDGLINGLFDIYQTTKVAKSVPIRGFVQVLKIVLYFGGVISVLAIVLDKSPFYFLGGLGAFAAVLMLVFKDPILNLVAGIQLAANNMVEVGDWIEVPSAGADGDVLDVTLTTVKVQNWDKTISTIPPYALVTGSFRNWRGMSESDGRRIKRSITLDMNSVMLCTPEMLERFARIEYIKEYIKTKREEVTAWNAEHEVDDEVVVNGRRMTNVGTFRAYVEAYLANHPEINQEMTLLVRQLAPGPEGLPIEIYVFSSDKVWKNYEGIQADIFDHLLAVIPEFDLRVYQQPTGLDFRQLSSGSS